MKKVAVILSGCGVYDGSEIHETVLTLLAIETHGAKYHCFAPNVSQHHVVNHLTGAIDEADSRNVLVESARIARGDIEDIVDLHVEDFDALLVPGGFGAAKNLCDFAVKGEHCDINPDVLNVCQTFARAHKPAGYLCIAPVMIPFIYGEDAQGTIGKDMGVAGSLINMGLSHVECEVDDIVVDKAKKLVTTPAYMLATSIVEAEKGINKLVGKVLSL